MPKQTGQKTRLLYVLEILKEYTDQEHRLTCDEILSHLSAYGIEADRKSIYDDIKTLSDYGLDIQNTRGKSGGYRLLSNSWQLVEIKMLIDAVQSSRFLTEKKSRQLIEKLKTLTSRYHAQALSRHIYIHQRAKSDNESIFYTADILHDAIHRGKKISFYYLDYLPNGTKVRRHNGKLYTVSPIELMIDDEKYYLIAIEDNDTVYRHYRVDKMEGTILLEDSIRTVPDDLPSLDLAKYSLSTFGMFGGEAQTVRLRAENRMASILIDRFDRENCTLIPDGEEHFTLAVRIVVSSQFFGWLFALEGHVEILSPPSVRNQYESMLKQALDHIQPKE